MDENISNIKSTLRDIEYYIGRLEILLNERKSMIIQQFGLKDLERQYQELDTKYIARELDKLLTLFKRLLK